MPVSARIAAWLLAALGAGIAAAAETGPPPVAEPLARGELVGRIPCRADPAQTYTLYLPASYDPGRRWPALLVFDPRGRSALAAELFRAAAERRGWIVLAADGTRSDGPMEPNLAAIHALWPEVHLRFATDPRRIYAAGFSGGGMLAWALARATGEIAGVVAVGARLERDETPPPLAVPTFGAAGETDFNFLEMRDAHRLLAARGVSERLETFAGPHAWFPAEMAAAAIDWLELLAMRDGLAAVDGPLVEALWQHDLAAAAAAEAAGRPLDAARRLARTERDFAGLRPTAEVARRADALAARPETVAAAAAEAAAQREERAWLARAAAANARVLAADAPPALARYLAEIDLAGLERRAHRSDLAGVSGRRLLATLLTQTSYYLVRDALARGRPQAAALFLDVATRIAPERPDLWYDLACVRARSGSRKAALAALATAIDRGFADRQLAEGDDDLAALRGRAEFSALLARLPPMAPGER